MTSNGCRTQSHKQATFPKTLTSPRQLPVPLSPSITPPHVNSISELQRSSILNSCSFIHLKTIPKLNYQPQPQTVKMKASFTLVAVGAALVAAQDLGSLPQCGVSHFSLARDRRH